MAVPKKRTGKSAQGHRRANWKATKPETTICPSCGAVVLTHTVCTECGKYKGKLVSIKNTTETKELSDTPKIASEEKTEDVKVEAQEEVKAEETVEENREEASTESSEDSNN